MQFYHFEKGFRNFFEGNLEGKTFLKKFICCFFFLQKKFSQSFFSSSSQRALFNFEAISSSLAETTRDRFLHKTTGKKMFVPFERKLLKNSVLRLLKKKLTRYGENDMKYDVKRVLF